MIHHIPRIGADMTVCGMYGGVYDQIEREQILDLAIRDARERPKLAREYWCRKCLRALMAGL